MVFCRGGSGGFGRDDRVGDGDDFRGGQGGRGVVGFGFRRGVVAVQVAEVAAVRFDDEGAAAEAVAVGGKAAPVAVEVEVGAVGGLILCCATSGASCLKLSVDGYTTLERSMCM